MNWDDPFDDPAVARDIEFGLRHGAFEDRLGRSFLKLWRIGALDREHAQMIHSRVRPLRMQEFFGTLLPFRSPRLHKGEILLGRDQRGRDLRIPLQWLVAGLLLAAGTGAGKTVLLSWLSLQIMATGCKVWFTDMYKTQLRHLRPLARGVGADLIVLPARRWKTNLLQPAGGMPHTHLTMAVDLLMRRLLLPPRARTILQQGCHGLYRRFGIWDGKTIAFPTLFDLYEWVRVTPGLNAAAREAILDRLGAFLIALTPECGAYRIGWSPRDLADYSIVFEMRGVNETVKQLLLEPTLHSLLLHDSEHGTPNAPICHFAAFEDSQRFFDEQRHGAGSLAPMAELAGVTRGSGRGLGVLVQSCQGLDRRLEPNLSTKIMGRMGSFEDYRRLASNLAMNPQQRDWCARHLKPGVFAAQVAEGNWREPFIFSVPLVKTPPVVDEDEVDRSLEPLDRLPVVRADEFSRWEPEHLIHVATANTAPQPSPAPSQPSTPLKPPKKEQLTFLESIGCYPFLSTKNRYKSLGLSAWKGTRTRNQLVKQELVEPITINPGGRGRRFQLLGLTRKGRDLLATYGISVASGHGRGGLEHQWWVHTIATTLPSDCNYSVEDESTGARIDLLIESDGRRIAVEVETSPGHEIANIRKDLAAGVDAVVSLVKDSRQLSRVRALASQEGWTNVHVGLLAGFSRIIPGVLAERCTGSPPKQNEETSEPNIPQDPPTPLSPPPLPVEAPIRGNMPLIEDLLEAVVLGGNQLLKERGGKKTRSRAPAKQGRLLRLLSENDQVDLESLQEEFAEEWAGITARSSGETARREFFRGMTDLATRINAALRAGYEASDTRTEMLNLTGRELSIATSHQDRTLHLTGGDQ